MRARLQVRQQSTKTRCPTGILAVLSHPATIPLSSRTLNHLADRIRTRRRQRRSRWRRLDPGRQALLTLAHLRNGDTYTRLAAGFGISITTAWRYVREAVDLLAAAADDLATAMARIRKLAHAILDGTLIPIDRVADQRPHYSGKHQRHGVNVQVTADAAGRLVWASPALPGAIHDLSAARAHGIIEALTSAGVMTFADKGYREPAEAFAHRSSATATGRNCPAASGPSIVRTPVSAPAASEPSPRSRAGRSWPSCAAVPAARPRSCRPSSSCTTSRPAATQDEKGSLYRLSPPTPPGRHLTAPARPRTTRQPAVRKRLK
jgi:hypothetical protein